MGFPCTGCARKAAMQPTSAGLSRCKGCGYAHYCGRACQAADWPLHKKLCKRLQARPGSGKTLRLIFRKALGLFTDGDVWHACPARAGQNCGDAGADPRPACRRDGAGGKILEVLRQRRTLHAAGKCQPANDLYLAEPGVHRVSHPLVRHPCAKGRNRGLAMGEGARLTRWLAPAACWRFCRSSAILRICGGVTSVRTSTRSFL
jgi:hypothetical protein